MSYLTDDTMLRYNAKDAVGTLVIANKVMPELIPDYRDTYDHTISMFRPLIYMMLRGVRVDQNELAKMKVKIDAAITDYQVKLNNLCGRPLNANSSKDCQKYFYDEKGVPPYKKYNKKTDTSAVTLDDKALQRLARGTATRRGFEEAKIIQRIRQLRKLKGTYLDIVFDRDSRLRCSYNPRGTRFGRISSSKTIFQTGMNMQNLPPAFMHFLVADDDRILIGMDKKQAEWVVVAYVSGDENMINAVESGTDVHSYTASRMFNLPIEIVKQEAKAVGSESDPERVAFLRSQLDFMKPYIQHDSGYWLPRTMSMRQCGKKSNHGLNYDEQPRMFSLINEITEKEAERIVDFYHGIYPGIRRYYETTRNQLATNRTLENLFGRRYRFLDKWGPNLFKSAYSYKPQSSVGELVNRAMDRIYDDSSPETGDLEILMQVHDSIDFQDQYSDLDKLVVSLRKIQSYMDIPLTANGRTFTIGTDLKIGFNFGKMEEINLRCSDTELKERIRSYIDEQKTPK